MVSSNWIGKACAAGKDLGYTITDKSVTFAAATTGAVAAKRLFTVTGIVYCTVFGICEVDLTSGGAATIEYGVTSDTDLVSGAITATAWDTDELSLNTTPVSQVADSDTVPQWIIVNGKSATNNVAYEVKTATITGGRVKWYCLWKAISADGNVQSAGVNQAA